MWAADATQLQMDSGHHGKVLFSISPSYLLPVFFFFFFKEREQEKVSSTEEHSKETKH